MTPASRTLRLLGQFLDGIIGGIPLVAAVILLVIDETLGYVLFIGGIGWSFFYYLLADGLHEGQSFAKQWLGVRVVGAESGAPCTFGQSFVRNLLLALLGPIDWVFIFGARRQRLGDKAAGTIVVSA